MTNNKNIDSQSESILLLQAREFKAADEGVLWINRRYRSLVWTLINYLYSYRYWYERAFTRKALLPPTGLSM